MAHMFRKYTSNRGSALFMVISTMTALVISCMAMYFSMVSARSSQQTVFNQMQARQSAQSIADIVKFGIFSPDGNPSAAGAKILNEMASLNEGESITTDANDFMSLDPGVATGLDESQLGAYSVTITLMSNDGDSRVYDIMVMTSVDGSRDVVHQTFTVTGPKEEAEGEAELFTATGYVPNDAYISGGYYLTDVFYDTQYTYMNTFGGSGENRIGLNLSTGGSLMMGSDAMSAVHSASSDAISPADVGKIGPVTWAIRGSFYANLGSDMGVRGGSQFLVGGDFIAGNGQNLFYIKNDGYTGTENLWNEDHNHISIYVNGDYDNGGADLKANTWLFVNGNVKNIGGNAQPNAKIFITGTPEERAAKMQCTTSTPVAEWEVDNFCHNGLNYTEAMALLGKKTATIAYYKWDVSGDVNTPSTQHIDIRLNATNSEWTDDKGTVYGPNERNFIISYDENTTTANLLKSRGGNENGVIGKSFIIDSVWTHGDNNNGQAIIIDTGDNPNNTITIQASDVTGDGVFSWFIEREEHVINWYPFEATYGPGKTPTGMINNNMRAVIVKGRGTVILDIPAGVTYQDAGYQFTGHVGWWLIEGGRVETKDGHLAFTGVDPQGKFSAKIVPYVLKACDPIDCVMHIEHDTVEECVICHQKKLYHVTCEQHTNLKRSYCSNCTPEEANREDWCKNQVNKREFRISVYNSLTGESKAAVTGKDGKIVYPNTNFMLVSCEESAEMRFSVLKDGSNATNNTLFGFIYAPYMSYLAAGGAQAGGLLKLCGGMTVADYDIQAINAYIGCYPDKMPNDLGGMSGSLAGTAKGWKVVVGGYR